MHRLVRRVTREWRFASSHQHLLTASSSLFASKHSRSLGFNATVRFLSFEPLRCSSSFDADSTIHSHLNQVFDDNILDPCLVNRNLYNLLLEPDIIQLAHRNLVSAHQKEFYERPGLVREIVRDLQGEKFQFESLPPPKNQQGEKPIFTPPPFRDKIVVEAMRITLHHIYEPIFLDFSHGYRPRRSRHTALRSVRTELRHHQHAFVGRIDSHDMNSHFLVNLLEQKIRDSRFIRLVWKALKAGHGNRRQRLWSVNNVWDGKPDAMTLSALLSNIYFHSLDCWIRDRKQNFDTMDPLKNTMDPLLLNLTLRIRHLEREGKLARAKVLRARKAQITAKSQGSASLRQLFYVRHGDEFLVSCIGTREEILTVKQDIHDFLKEEMLLNIPEAEWPVSRLHSSHAFFLGTRIRVSKSSEGASSAGFRVRLEAPMEKIIMELDKLGMVSVGGRIPHPVTYLARCSHNEIVRYYNWVMRGCCEYYSFVDNFYELMSYLRIAIRSSCVRTLTMKLKRFRSARTYKDFGTECAARYRVPIRNGIQVVDDQLPEEAKTLLQNRMRAAKMLRLDWEELGTIEKGLLLKFIIPKRIQEPNGDVNLEFRGDYLLFCSKNTEHEETKRALRKLELLPPAQNLWNFQETLVPPPRPQLSIDYESLYPF